MASETVYTCDRCGRKPNEAPYDNVRAEGNEPPPYRPGQAGPSGPLTHWRHWAADRQPIDKESRGESYGFDLCSACDDEMTAWMPRGARRWGQTA